MSYSYLKLSFFLHSVKSVKIHKNYKNHSKCVIILFTVDVEIR